MNHQNKIDAKAYVLWCGQIDVRDLELMYHDGKYWYEDLTEGFYNFTTDQYNTIRDAKQALENECFNVGDPGSWIQYDGYICRTPKGESNF